MKTKKASAASQLEDIPNIGPALAKRLRAVGIHRPDQLKGKDGIKLYQKLNKVSGIRHDPCVADTFMAAVDFMKTGKGKPWWEFTPKRKKLFSGRL
jgi:Pathogenicity locus